VPILAITTSVEVSRRLCLLWGTHSALCDTVQSYEEMVRRATELAKREKFAGAGDALVVVAGIPLGEGGTTNNLRVVWVS
jgi:pyruvate kinase